MIKSSMKWYSLDCIKTKINFICSSKKIEKATVTHLIVNKVGSGKIIAKLITLSALLIIAILVIIITCIYKTHKIESKQSFMYENDVYDSAQVENSTHEYSEHYEQFIDTISISPSINRDIGGQNNDDILR